MLQLLDDRSLFLGGSGCARRLSSGLRSLHDVGVVLLDTLETAVFGLLILDGFRKQVAFVVVLAVAIIASSGVGLEVVREFASRSRNYAHPGYIGCRTNLAR